MNKSQSALAMLGPFLIFVAAMLWATDAPFRVFLTGELNSSFIVLAEHFIDILIALPLLLLGWSELKKLSAKEWVAVLVIAIGSSALASIAFTESFRYVNPSVAILLQKLQPLVAIALATILLKETLRAKFWLWAILAIAGAYLLSFPKLVPQVYEGEIFNPNTMGVLLALVAAALWAVGTVLGRFVLRTITFKTLTSLRFVGAFIFLLIFNLSQDSIPALSTVSGKDWLFIVIVAVTSGLVSLFLYYYGLQYTRASVATLAELGFPLAAVLINAYFIESVHQPGTFLGLFALQWLGTALLLFALYRLSRFNQAEKIDIDTAAQIS